MAGPLWRAAAFVQRHRAGLLVGSCAGLFGAQISYHLFPDPVIRWLYQYWPQGQPAPLSPELQSLFQEQLRVEMATTVPVESVEKARVLTKEVLQAVRPWLG